jgi:acyl-CoA thioesterase FadM
MHFRYATTITLFDTDASGLLFYGSLFRLTQSCFEAFLRERGLPIEAWITGNLPVLPVRKVEADYRAPLKVGTQIEISVTDLSIGTSSLTITYSVVDTERKTECATAAVTHVAVDRREMKAIPIPADIAKELSRRVP